MDSSKGKTATPQATPQGGLGAVRGLRVTGVSAGFRKNPNRRDLALIVAEPGSVAAGVFTRNVFAAAPVLLSRKYLEQQAKGEGGGFRALIINSGNANAATGAQGIETANRISKLTAEALSCAPEQVLVASTGVIGVQLSLAPFEAGIPKALAELGAGAGSSAQQGRACAEAIMTTDTVPKTAARSFTVEQANGNKATYTVGGMAKGSGMIAPNMATMIAVLATDAALSAQDLQQALAQAVDVSFNKVTIDSDTSTNDSAYLIATGAEPGPTLKAATPNYEVFVRALIEVCQDLAYQIAQDGEGATKVIVVDVTGAATQEDAERAARAIADSPLVKTAVAGHDANWGRIAMAAGKSGATFTPEGVSIAIMELAVLKKGISQEFCEAEALRRFAERSEVHLAVDLGAGTAHTRMWSCDLTKEYVAINGDYRT